MRVRRIGLAAMLGAFLMSGPARAADTAPQGQIQGQDVMGDKGRTGPDGWSWAPTTRDQAPTNKGAGQGAANVRDTPNTQPGPNEGKQLPPGDDPGTPASADSHGPGTMDSSAAR